MHIMKGIVLKTSDSTQLQDREFLMRTTRWIQCLAALVVGLVSVQSVSATTVIGRTPGSFGVSPMGDANYSVPIWAPPGPRGFKPQIALVYDHRSGSGSMGVGWSLAGLSRISRCSRTIGQDGAAGPVQLAMTDAFCLDGARLRLTSSDTQSTYGQPGTTYQTEIANFSNVTANGTAGNGPAYFIVQGRDGYTYEYGNTTDSQIISSGATTPIAWALDKVTDRYNNTVLTISYVSAGTAVSGVALPAVISWSPTSAGASNFNYKMTFSYTPTNIGPSTVVGYVAGSSLLNQESLTSINIANGSGATLKLYSFSYLPSQTTGINRLTRITECSDSGGTNCLLPTTISYQDGQAGVSTTPVTPITNSVGGAPHVYDVNGDGYPDLLYANGSGLYVALGSSSGYGTPFNTGVPKNNFPALFGDLLANGKSGILASDGTNWTYYTFTASGSAFSGVPAGAYDSFRDQFILADIDGDGRPDLVSSSIVSGITRVFTQPNTSSSTAPSFGGVTIAYAQSNSSSYAIGSYAGDSIIRMAGNLHGLDFDADGRQDIALVFNNGTTKSTYELTSNGSTFTGHLISNDPATAIVTFLNFNSDSCTEVITNGILHPSGCNGASPTPITAPSSNVVWAMDWDGDGRTDLLVQNGSTLDVYPSTGNGFGSVIHTGISSSGGFFPIDANADGLDDLGFYSGTQIGYYAHNQSTKKPDLVIGIADGYGVNYSPTYVPTTWGSYTATSVQTDYPEKNVYAPIYVVSSVTQSDGVGGNYVRTFSYVGARTHLKGRGFEGFESVTESDNRGGSLSTNQTGSLVRKTSYGQLFPYTALPTQVDLYQHDGVTLLSRTTLTNTYHGLNATVYNQRGFVFVSSSTRDDRELGGTLNGASITTTTQTNSVDDYGNTTSSSTTVADSDSTSPYTGQSWNTTVATTYNAAGGVANWCINIPTQITVTRSASNITARTRTVGFDPSTDYLHCRINTQVTEPGNSSYQVTRALGYDGFGNVNSVTETGSGMAARVTTTDWGTTGQFPVTIRDAVSNSLGASGYKTVKGYDYNLGLQTSEVVQSADGSVANAPPMSWQYDVFGRRQQETRSDGTYTTWTFSDCASSGGCLAGPHGLIVGRALHSTDGSVQTDGSTWLDQLDRRVLSTKRSFAAGAYDLTGVQYDNFGQKRVQDIPCAWSGAVAHCPYGLTLSYDALGRVFQSQRPINSGNTTLQTATIQYAGRTVTSTDPQGVSSVKINTVAGTLGISRDPTGYQQTFTYDAFDSVLSVTDSLSNTLFTGDYDYGVGAFPRNATAMDLDVSITAGQHRHFNYDALGELTSWSDAKGQSFSQTYDANARPLTRIEPDLTTNWTWGHTASNHDVGQLSVVSANGYTESFTYDPDARVQNRSVTIPSDATYTYDFSYNGITGFLDTLTYPQSTASYRLKLSYAYQNGYLKNVSDAIAGTIYWQANAMNPWGQVTQETLGNGVVTTRTLDSITAWPSAITSGLNGSAALQNESYLFDELGNVTQRQNNNAGLTENFWYDSDYRLEHSTLNGTLNLQMHYDGSGNITARSDLANGTTWTYDPVHKHGVTQAGAGGYTYTYDANGNVTARNGLGINWTSYNHPSLINTSGSGESVQFAYTHTHERWKAVLNSSGGTETTYFIGDLLEKVSTAGATDYRHYILAGGTKVAIYSRTSGGTNTLHYVREDHQGSVATILNSDGSTYVKESFTAFGARRNACTWSGPPTNGQLTKMNVVTRHGYTWQTALGAMGLNDMNGRIQDAVTGRFLSADPTAPEVGISQDFNRYSYVRNNPLTYADPTGFTVAKGQYIDLLNLTPSQGGSGGGFSGGTLIETWKNWQTCSDGSCQGGSSVTSILLGGGSAGGNENEFSGSGSSGVGGGFGGGGSGSGGTTSPSQQIPCRAGVNCYVQEPPKVEVNPEGCAAQAEHTAFNAATIVAGTVSGALASKSWSGAAIGLIAGVAVSQVADATGAESTLTRATNAVAGVATSREYSGAAESVVTDEATSGWQDSDYPAVKQVAGSAVGGAVVGAIRGGIEGGWRGGTAGGLRGGKTGAIIGATYFGIYAATWNLTFARCIRPQ